MSAHSSLLDALRRRKLTLACAESCTGGLLAARLTEVPGAGDSFLGSVVSYADSAKVGVLGVDPVLLSRKGGVSREVAEAMAHACRMRFNADLALSVTGFAGPNAPEGKLGLTFIGAATKRGNARVVERTYGGSREDVRRQAVDDALALATAMLDEMRD